MNLCEHANNLSKKKVHLYTEVSSLHMLHVFMLNEKEQNPSVVSSLGIAMIDNEMKRYSPKIDSIMCCGQ